MMENKKKKIGVFEKRNAKPLGVEVVVFLFFMASTMRRIYRISL
jgi:hypothetical protein